MKQTLQQQTNNPLVKARLYIILLVASAVFVLQGCDLIRMKKNQNGGEIRKPVARVNEVYLYQDELEGIVSEKTTKEDSMARVTGYVNTWIRKQLLINEATKKININEAEVERKVLDYRYSLIGYEFQNYYIKQNLNDSISDQEIADYYNGHLDNFILKQNIIQGTYIKVAKEAPRTNRIKDLIIRKKKRTWQNLNPIALVFLPLITWQTLPGLSSINWCTTRLLPKYPIKYSS